MLFDFRCTECGDVHEKFVESSVKSLVCECGGTMTRLITPVRFSLEGHSGHFPTAADKWARQHEKEGRKPSDTDPRGW